jgi:predicted transcriptional regulator
MKEKDGPVNMAEIMNKGRMQVLIAAKILQKRHVTITSRAIAKVADMSVSSVANRLKLMEGYYIIHSGIVENYSLGKANVYKLSKTGDKAIRNYLLTDAA